MSVTYGGFTRPKIALNSNNKVTHDGDVCRVVVRRNLISVACTDITPEAMRKVLADWEKHFGAGDQVVIQIAGE